MNTKNKTIQSFITTLAATALMSSAANAVVIISDDFSNDGPLNGSLTDTGQTWSATPTLNTSGGLLVVNASQGATISGLNLVTDCVYTLSMDLNVTSAGAGGSGWIGMGFKTTSYSNLVSGSVGSILHRFNPEVRMFSQNSSNVQTVAAQTGAQNLEIILQTGTTLANSTVSWKVDGVQAGVSQTTNASNVDGVFFHNVDSGFGTIDNYTLTHNPVPEPSSSLLLGLGGLGLILRRSRSAKA